MNKKTTGVLKYVGLAAVGLTLLGTVIGGVRGHDRALSNIKNNTEDIISIEDSQKAIHHKVDWLVNSTVKMAAKLNVQITDPPLNGH